MAPKRTHYSVHDLMELTRLTPHPMYRSNLDANLIPKLRALKIGRRYGGKMYPLIFTRHEIIIVLRFLCYRGYLKDRSLIHKFAPYNGADITESVMIARAMTDKQKGNSTIFPHERAGMEYAIRVADEAIAKYDAIPQPEEPEPAR